MTCFRAEMDSNRDYLDESSPAVVRRAARKSDWQSNATRFLRPEL
jgi:hypothetical protein